MALIRCPECNHEVSDTAETCPHCGYRLRGIPQQTSYSYRASRIVEREHNLKHTLGIIGSVIGLVAAIVFFILSYAYSGVAQEAVRETCLIGGFLMLLISVPCLIYSIYKLRNY